MKTITLEFLKEKDACANAVVLFEKTFGESASVEATFKELIRRSQIEWANWFIAR